MKTRHFPGKQLIGRALAEFDIDRIFNKNGQRKLTKKQKDRIIRKNRKTHS